MARHGRTGIARVIEATAGGLAVLLALGSVAVASSHGHGRAGSRPPHHRGESAGAFATATPIKHLVVVFQENRSFDRYFGTYPHALNPPGEPRFVSAPGTAHSQRAHPGPAHAQPEPCQSRSPRAGRWEHVRLQSHVPGRAEVVRHGLGRQVRPERRANRSRLRPDQSDGLLRRQHRHRAVELRPALLDQRQLVRDDLRSFARRRGQPDQRQ